MLDSTRDPAVMAAAEPVWDEIKSRTRSPGFAPGDYDVTPGSSFGRMIQVLGRGESSRFVRQPKVETPDSD